MSLEFRFGRADAPSEFDTIARTAAEHPGEYEPKSHRSWAHGKFLTYMKNGLAIPCPVLHGDVLASVVVGYMEPPLDTEDLPGIEAKLVRTLQPYYGHGLARLGVKTLFVNASREMGLRPGSEVRMHLDTRSPQTIGAFAAMGFVETARTQLYDPNPGDPQSTDVLMERIFTVPEYL